MKFALLLSILFTSSAFAQDWPDCRPAEPFATVKDILDGLQDKICPTDDEVIMKRVTQEYQNFFGDLPQINQNVMGFNLSGSDQELKIAKDMLGKKPPQGWIRAAEGCSTIQCAFEKLFKSKEAAMQVMNFHAKTGYYLGLDQTINGNFKDQIWSSLEVREMDAVISKIPDELKKLKYLSEINRLADGLRQHGHGPMTGAYALSGSASEKSKLVFYDIGLHRSTSGKNAYDTVSWPQEVMIHELCHHHDNSGSHTKGINFSQQPSLGFKALSGWKEQAGPDGKSKWIPDPNAAFVSNYSKENPGEDYAEACMNFILHPVKLREKAPQKYSFMKDKVFNGKEFTNTPWVLNEKNTKWPKLEALLANETACHSNLHHCMKGLTFNGLFMSAGFGAKSVKNHIFYSECFKKYKNKRLQEINTELENEPDYCKNGAKNTINTNLDKICAKTTSVYTSTLDNAAKTIMDASNSCDAKGDRTFDCVKKSAHFVNVPEIMAPILRDVFTSKPKLRK